MAEALRLARRGIGSCHPNPMVGCVIEKGGDIVGRGWHQRAGDAHAEINALADAGDAARDGTAYVTLEPCSHEGRTGPCVRALVQAGIKEVVAATTDPDGRVQGKGFQWLEQSGVVVRTGLMAEQAMNLNPGFFSRHQKGRPWVRVKLAASLDGRTALHNGVSQWITSEASRADVQHWRRRASAVLTGIGTVIGDDPSLNVRGESGGHQPHRIIVDSHWRTPASARTLTLPGRVIIAGLERATIPGDLKATKAEFLRLPDREGRVDLESLLGQLADIEVNELQVEAGASLCGSLLRAGLVDELLLYLAPQLLGNGARGLFSFGPLGDMGERIQLDWLEADRVGPDWRFILRPRIGEI